MSLNSTDLQNFEDAIFHGDANAISNYYDYLIANGIPYGNLAKEVATASGFFGTVATDYFNNTVAKEHPDWTPSQIDAARVSVIEGLAVADIDARLSDINLNGGDGNIPYATIDQYHLSLFTNTDGLNYDDWAGAGFSDFLGPGSYMAGIDPNVVIPPDQYASALEALTNNQTSANGINAQQFFGDFGVYANVLHNSADWSHLLQSVESVYGLLGGDSAVIGEKYFGALIAGAYGTTIAVDLSLTTLSQTLEDAFRAIQHGLGIMEPHDPLVLDLGHDGLTLSSVHDSGAHFDLDNNGFAEHTGWVGPGEGFLVRDLNANGTIDNQTEMFGSATQTGLAQLATLDSNADGVIDSNDTAWSTLKVWVDANGNGATDSGELHSLGDFGITSLSYEGQPDGRTIDGNYVNGVASFTDATGQGALAEVFFLTDNFDTQYVGDGGTDANIDASTLDLPLSRGYGTIPSLQVAMSNDATLKSMVGALSTDDYDTAHASITGILYRWAGVDSGTLPDVSNYDPEKLAFLEAFSGQAFTNLIAGGTAVEPLAIPFLDQAWNSIYEEMSTRLLVQGALADIFPHAAYSFTTDTLTLGASFADIMTAVNNDSALAGDFHFHV